MYVSRRIANDSMSKWHKNDRDIRFAKPCWKQEMYMYGNDAIRQMDAALQEMWSLGIARHLR